MLRRSCAIAGLAVIGILAAAARDAAIGVTRAPSPAILTFEGRHVPDATLPAGLRHEGRFTAATPFCASGTAADIAQPKLAPLTVHRLYTCDDGTGSFTAVLEAAVAEHPPPFDPDAHGPWSVVAGTGRFATLRGRGTYTGTILSGEPTTPLTIAYRSTWQGVVDFDATPPNAALASAKAAKLRKPAGAYSLRLVLDVRDNTPGNAVAWEVTVRAGSAPLANRHGSTASGNATLTFGRLKPPKRTPTLRVEIDVSDPLGNDASAARTVRLPR